MPGTPRERRSAPETALTVAWVATGRKAGVGSGPWAVERTPALASVSPHLLTERKGRIRHLLEIETRGTGEHSANPNRRRTVEGEETETLFSRFLPAARGNAESRALEVKSPPRCRMCIRRGSGFQTALEQRLCLLPTRGLVWFALTECLPGRSPLYTDGRLLPAVIAIMWFSTNRCRARAQRGPTVWRESWFWEARLFLS